MEFEFTPIDYDYFDFNGQNFIKMIGRRGDGKKICVVDSYEANFYLILEDEADADEIIERIKNIEVEKGGRVSKILKTRVLDKKFLGRDVKVIRVWISNHKDSLEMVSALGDLDGVRCRREFDLGIVSKYIKENKVEPLCNYKIVSGEHDCLRVLDGLDVEEIYFGEKFSRIDGDEFVPKVMSYDIETSEIEIGKGEILMISYSDGNRSGVISWKDIGADADYVEIVEDEASMIERFCEIVREGDVDILTGYFSDGFDLPYLKTRADKFKIVLDLGVNGRAPTFARGRIPSGKINGVVHVDLFRFVSSVFSQYLKSESLSLNEVTNELVGSGKEDFDFARMKNMGEKDWVDFFSYSLRDAVVTHKLASKLWPDLVEFSKITKEPLFDVSRVTMARHVENHILHNLDRFDEIAERRPGNDEVGRRKMRRGFEGAFVFEPTPGFYEDIVMFDFTSMHSSLMVTYNICGQALRLDDEKWTIEDRKKYNASPEFDINGERRRVWFDKEIGFFSTLLSEVVDKRKEAKDAWKKDKSGMSKARSNAYKLLANATFGYQGFFGARYYSYEAAAATLAFVRKLIHDTMDMISGEGFKILYGDTDSIAFLRNGKSDDEIKEFLKKINKSFPGIIELDLEGFFRHGLFVAKRDSKVGAKKKYALIDDKGKVKIRGFESVRRDWCGLSRKLQDKVLRMILKDGNEKRALMEVKDIVGKLKRGEVERGSLLVKTKMKRQVEDYIAQGPHVAAAKKMIDKGMSVGIGTFVEYYIGEGTSKRVGDRVYLSNENAKYDVEYYLKKQILPAVEGIFDVFGVDISAEIEGERQEKLF